MGEAAVAQDYLFEILAVAENSARAAGEMIKRKAAQYGHCFGMAKSKMNNRDLVTEVDQEAERIIQTEIRNAFPPIPGRPTHAFLGEEEVSEKYGSGYEASTRAVEEFLANDPADYKWVCDPLDGTANFVTAIPLYCVSLACTDRDGVVVAGAIYDPLRDELFSAARDRGFRINGHLHRVRSSTKTIGDALCAMNFCPDAKDRTVSVKGFMAMQMECRSMRITGSSALSLAWVAAGRIDLWWGNHLNCWDLSAGSLLVAEAGGVVSEADGRPYELKTTTMLASASPELMKAAYEKLRPALLV